MGYKILNVYFRWKRFFRTKLERLFRKCCFSPHTKEMVRIFQVVNLSILDTNLSFIELQNFLVNAELLYYIEILYFSTIFYLYHLRKNFKCYLNKCRLKCNLETRIFKHLYHIKITHKTTQDWKKHTSCESQKSFKTTCKTTCKTTWSHVKLCETTWNQAKPRETKQNHVKRCKTTQNHAKLRKTKQNQAKPLATMRNYMQPCATMPKTLEIKAWREYEFEFSRFPIAITNGANIQINN